ncbi:MAG TPA: APC family permease [Blastocatellia bacterium]|nr:APC family permease [Blastocatellia bacterium]
MTQASLARESRNVELRRDLTKLESYATIIGILVGSGIFVVTGKSGAIAGPSIPLAYLVLAPVVLMTAVAYSVYLSTPLGTRPGGEYLHISRTTRSYYAGFVALWLKWLSYIGALVILSVSLAQYLKFFYPGMDQWFVRVLPFGEALGRSYVKDPTLGEAVIATAALICFLVFNLLGVKVYGRLQTIMTIIKCLAVIVLVVPGVFAIDWNNFSPLFPRGFLTTSTPEGDRGFLAVLAPLFFAYAGFESLAQTAGETKDSRKSLPMIFINGVLISMVIFFLMSLVAFGVVPYQELAQSSFAMSDAAARYLPWWGGAVVTIGALMAFSTCLNATLFVPARILYVFGEDRVLPRWLSSVSERFRTPWVSLVVNAVIAVALLWTKSFGYVLDIAIVGMFLVYAMHSASLMLLPFVRPALYQKARVKLHALLLVVLGFGSVASMIYLTVVTIARDISRHQALPPSERGLAIWQLLLVWVAVGTVFYLFARWEGRRSGFDYDRLLTQEWADDQEGLSEKD